MVACVNQFDGRNFNWEIKSRIYSTRFLQSMKSVILSKCTDQFISLTICQALIPLVTVAISLQVFHSDTYAVYNNDNNKGRLMTRNVKEVLKRSFQMQVEKTWLAKTMLAP